MYKHSQVGKLMSFQLSLMSNFGRPWFTCVEYACSVEPLAGSCSETLLVEVTVLGLLAPVAPHCWLRSQFLP